MKKTTDIYKPYSPTVQIGDRAESITDIAVNQAKMLEYKLPEQKIDILTSARENATNLIKSGFNGYVVANGNEICIMDTDDKNTAQKVWRWNENGFGFSNTGYDGTYGTAMTMDGAIVADFITAGVLHGIEISNGDGTFRVSPDGKVTASAMNITGGTIKIQTESSENDVISLNCGESHLHIKPAYFTVINPNRNAVNISGEAIRGYSYFWNGEADATFTLDTATGNISTNGDISGKEVRYLCNGEYVSTRQEIDKVHAEINSLSETVQSNYDDLWGQIQYIFDTLDFITGGGNS